MILQLFASGVLIAGTVSPSLSQSSDPFPTRPVTVVVATPAGGPTDLGARLISERLSEKLGKNFIIENRPGASQTLGTGAVARSQPDGYTLLFSGSGPMVIAPLTVKNASYDVRRDFKLVARVGSLPLVLYVDPKLPVANLQELVSFAQAKPGQVTYGSYGAGTSAHLLGEHLAKTFGISLVHVPFSGISPEIQALVGGHINLAIADVASPSEQVKAGSLRAIAITGSQRVPLLPDVPTFAEQGVVGGMEIFSAWWGLFSPSGTPQQIVAKLASATADVARSREFEERVTAIGVSPSPLTGPEAEAFLETELTTWERTIGEMQEVLRR